MSPLSGCTFRAECPPPIEWVRFQGGMSPLSGSDFRRGITPLSGSDSRGGYRVMWVKIQWRMSAIEWVWFQGGGISPLSGSDFRVECPHYGSPNSVENVRHWVGTNSECHATLERVQIQGECPHWVGSNSGGMTPSGVQGPNARGMSPLEWVQFMENVPP